jgi:hypothetical protein
MVFALVSLVLILMAVVALGGIVVGTVMFFIRPLRQIAPFVFCIPLFSVIGALALNYALGYGLLLLFDKFTIPPTLPTALILLLASIAAFPVGALLGAALGLLAALWIRKNLKPLPPPVQNH